MLIHLHTVSALCFGGRFFVFVSFHLFLHCLLCQDLIVLGTGVTAQWSGVLVSMEEDPALA